MSKIGLAHDCSYWARDDVQCPERASGRAARVGSLVHMLAEAVVTKRGMGETDDLHEYAEAKEIFDGPFRGWLTSRDWLACELGLRFDSVNDTATKGPRRGEAGYDDHGPMVLKGTLDLVGIVEAEKTLVVIDIKTGQRQHASQDQLYAQAVAAARKYNVQSVAVGFVFPRKTKCASPELEHLDADRLDEEAGRIHRTLRLLPTAEPNPGEHCWKKWCPMYEARTCPAHKRDESNVVPLYDDALSF